MFDMFNPANLVRKLARTTARSESSFQAREIARWENEGGAPKASERHTISHDEEYRDRALASDDEQEASLMRQGSPGSNSRELRAHDDLYHQSFWKGQN
jgi:hypothetical protein